MSEFLDPMLECLATRMGIDVYGMNPPLTSVEFADLYEAYTSRWDEFHVKEQAAKDVWAAFKGVRRDTPQLAINTAIQVGFAHGLRLSEICAILGTTWQDFIAGFFLSSKRSRLEDDLSEADWGFLETVIHGRAAEGSLTYGFVRQMIQMLGSDCQGHALRRLVGRFGYDMPAVKYAPRRGTK